MGKDKFKVPECPACGSSNVITNKNGDRWCRRCGHAWDPSKKGGTNGVVKGQGKSAV